MNDVKELLLAALEVRPPERAAFLAGVEDGATRRRVEALLEAHDAADERIDTLTDAPDLVRHLRGGAPRVGRRVGPYELLERIGEGGFGVVFHARQETPVRRDVALKVVKAGMDTEVVLARFEAEGRALALMDHPHIARVLEFGTTERGAPYFVMELVDGEPITTWAEQRGLGLRERLRVFVDVCLAVQHAHQKGVVHRDVKPGNVLVTEVDGQPVAKVIDFGIAKALMPDDDGVTMTRHGHLIGTPESMSPEQLAGSSDIDTRADVYALGALLYELLAGRPPFDLRGLDLAQIVRRVEVEEPVRPSRATRVTPGGVAVVPADLDWICLRCLEKERGRRYASASDLARDVERFLDELPVDAAPPSTWYRVRKLAARHRALAVTGGVVMVALLVAVGGLWAGLAAARRANDETIAALASAEAEARRARGVLRFFTDELLAAAVPSGEPGRGRDVRVVDVLDVASRRLDAGARPDDPLLDASLRWSLGTSYAALGQPDVAAGHLAVALDELRVLHGELHVDVLDAQLALIDAQITSRDVAAAGRELDALEAALADAPVDKAPYDRLRHAAVGHRAMWHLERGEYDDARRGLERLVAAAVDEQPPTRLAALDKLALLEALTGHGERAVALFGQVYDGRTAWLGPDDPLTLTARLNLGNALRAVGRHAEAVEHVDAAVAGLRDVLGASHPDTFVARLARAWLGIDRNAYDEAREALDALEVDVRRTLGPHSAELVDVLDASAVLALATWDVERGTASAREAQRLALDVYGAEHPTTWNVSNTLAALLDAGGAHDEAHAIVTDVFAARERALGPEHPATIQALVNLGVTSLQRGELDEAGARFDDALQRLRARGDVVGDDELRLQAHRAGLAALEARHGAAVEIATSALDAVESGAVVSAETETQLRFRRAWSQAALGRHDDAVADIAEAWALQHDLRGPDSPEARELAGLAAEWSVALGRSDDAAHWTSRTGP